MIKKLLKKMMNRSGRSLCAALLLLGVSASLQAQVTVTIPANNDNDDWQNFPYGCADGYQRVQSLYTASEIGLSGNITTIGFYVNALNNPSASTPVVVKLRNTKSTTVSRASYDDASLGATTVYTGNILSSQLAPNGWVTVTLAAPFVYAGYNLELFVETNNGTSGEDYDAKQFRWSEMSNNVSQMWSGWNTPPGAFDYGYFSTMHPNVRFTIAQGSAMAYASATTEQVTAATHTNASNQHIIAIKIQTNGLTNAVSATGFNLNTNGSSATPGIIQNARLYFTGISPSFDSTQQFGSTVNNPSGTFSFTGNRVLDAGTNYFWLAYDISSSAVSGDSVDGECTQVTIGSTNYTPSVTAPAGKIPVGRLYNFEAASNQGFYTNTFSSKPNQWQRGTPVEGPAAAFSGTNCWGTNLNGDYDRNVDYALNTPPFIVDKNDASISYKQWYDFASEYNDLDIFVEYQVGNTGWQVLAEIVPELKYNTAGKWEDVLLNLPALAGDTIQLRWHLITAQYTDLATGWYIDNFVLNGAHTYNQSYLSSYTGQLAGLTLPGSKTQPVVNIVIETSGSDNPLSASNFNFTTAGTGTVSNIESARVYSTGADRNFDTLTAYGSAVMLPSGAFNIAGLQNLLPGTNHFWLVYDVSANATGGDSLDATCTQITLSAVNQTPLETDPEGNLPIGALYDFDTSSTQAFRGSALNSAPNQWEKGIPTSGPSAAYSGTDCWGTNLNGNYSQGSDYVLLSPPYIATGILANITYKQWYNFRWTYAGIDAEFEYQVNNSGFWNTINYIDNSLYASSNNNWEDAFGQVGTNPGDTVQFRWHFRSGMWSSTAPGWYIDNFAIAGLRPFNQSFLSSAPETVFSATHKGAVNQPILRIPVEVSGSLNPLTLSTLHFNTNGTGAVTNIDSARVFYSGSNKSFDANTQFGSTVASPSGAFNITGTQELVPGTNYFWLTYDVDTNALVNDSLDAELSQLTISAVAYPVPVTAPAGYVAVGRLYEFDTASLQDFSASPLNSNPNQWEKGLPNSGPYSAYSGTDCWATSLNGNVNTSSDYAVFSPPYVAVFNEVNVSFKQWFDFFYTYSDIDATFEYQVNNSGWNINYNIDNSVRENSNYTWENVESGIIVNAGDTVQFRWRLKSSPWSPQAPGWYFDNFVVSGVDFFEQTYQFTTISQVNEATLPGTRNQAIINIAVNTLGSKNPLQATSFNLSTNGSVNAGIASAQLFYTGPNNTFDTLTPFGAVSLAPSGSFVINGTQSLGSGVNNFWLAYTVSPGAAFGDSLDAQCTQITISATPQNMPAPAPAGNIPVGRLYAFDTASMQGFTAMSLNSNVNQWQKGTPSSGPSAAYSGTDCWATNLNGDFNPNSDYVLLSPPYIAHTDVIFAAYKQWFDFLYTNNEVTATFESNINNTGWNFVTEIDNQVRENSSSNWESVKTQVFATIGDTVQFRWRFQTTNWSSPAPGWYIDDLILAGVSPFGQAYHSSFAEQVLGGTYAGAKQSPVIKVTVETLGSNTPLTISDLSFNTAASASIIQSARLYYTGNNNTFDTSTSFGSAVGSPSGPFSFTGSEILNPGPNYFWLAYDVTSAALEGDSLDATCTQLTIAGITQTPAVTNPAGKLPVGRLYNFEVNNNQDFTTASLNNTPVEWERGVPSFINGPATAYSGTRCWGTNLSGNFTLNSDYTLLTPPYVATDAYLVVNYKQWYEFIYTSWNKRAQFQYQVNNSGIWNNAAAINLMNVSSSDNNWLD
ncbi:MAG: BNR-repeat neuraminidase N-terminal domain-containing protein, partial [Bacteroidota bacterium]